MSESRLESALAETSPDRRDLVLEKQLAAWLVEDPAAAARFAERQADSFLREVALRTVAQGWARISPASAARWAESLAANEEHDQALEHIALVSAADDPETALALLAHRFDDKLPDTALAGVVTSWASRDYTATENWLESQPASAARDTVAQLLVQQRARDDPRGAAMLIERAIGGEAARRETWAALAQLWSRQDPGLVREWAAYADPATRQRIEAELALAGDGRD
jgi:hypothetical protein